MFNTESRYGSKDEMLTELYKRLFRREILLDNVRDLMSGKEELANKYAADVLVLTTEINLLNELICVRTNQLRGQ